MDPLLYCQDKAAPAGSGLYYALRRVPDPTRSLLLGIEAMIAEITGVIAECEDTGVAQTRLGWWQEEVTRACDGAPRHPVTQLLATLNVPGFDPDRGQRAMEHCILATAECLRPAGLASGDDLLDRCRRMRGEMYALVHDALALDEGNRDYVNLAGIATQATRMLRQAGLHAARRRLMIPAQDLAAAGLNEQGLHARQDTDASRDLFSRQAARARAAWTEALGASPERPHPLHRGIHAIARLDLALLTELERDNYPLLTRDISLTPLRKLWVTTRARLHY